MELLKRVHQLLRLTPTFGAHRHRHDLAVVVQPVDLNIRHHVPEIGRLSEYLQSTRRPSRYPTRNEDSEYDDVGSRRTSGV